jgi:hypothetical protein
MTAVKKFKRHTPAREMMDRRIAWLKSDTDGFIEFTVYSRNGETKYPVVIRKSDLHTTCPCEDRKDNCWHMRLAMYSYLLRIQRGEVN